MEKPVLEERDWRNKVTTCTTMIIRGRYDSESDLVYCYEKDETGSNVEYKRESDTVYNMARRTETEQRERQRNSRRKSKEEKVYEMVNGCWILKDGSGEGDDGGRAVEQGRGRQKVTKNKSSSRRKVKTLSIEV